LLVNYRPEYRHEWSGRAHYLQLRLDPLRGENAGAMLEALLGNGADLVSLKRQVTHRTGGNPFFIEEMVRALFEQGILVQNGSVKQARPLEQAYLPVTVQGVLAARIDRLPAGDRELLHTVAVFGREFPLELVQRMAAAPTDELKRGLSRLQAGGFIYEQPAADKIEFAFKHALTQEVAYNSILVERRKVLHERIAHAIEALFAHRLDDHLADLARHYSQSGNASKATHFLRLAGEQAGRRSAHEEAIGFFKAALAIVDRLPDNQERLQTLFNLNFALLGSLAASRGYATPEAESTASIALELAQRLNDPQLQFSASMFEWAFHQVRRDLPAALHIAERLLESANDVRDPFMIVHANYASGSVSLYRGEIRAAVEKLEIAQNSYKPGLLRQAPQDPGVLSRMSLALAQWVSGRPDRALRAGDEAISLARHLAHPLTLAFALTYQTVIYLCRREASSALEIAEEARDLALQRGFQYWNALASTYRGIALSAIGKADEGITVTLEGIGSYRATGSELGAALIMVGLASSYLNAGRIQEVLTTVAQGLATTRQTGARLSDAELYRLKGEALLRNGPGFELGARSCFESAIATARNQESKAWELRATTSLARVLAQQGRRHEARTMLAEIYGWFTEGFDTADLKEAKVLLDELSKARYRAEP
jgi:tetratricopeptide (TPR) repeat protein